MILVSDNDFSVTQTGQGVQFDVCTSGIGGISSQVALGAACPDGQALIKTYTYVFKVSGDSLALVPEPATWAMMIAGFGLVGGALRRRRAAMA
ncbi:MAG: PEPxxWA-CTERM sorting domain-containing protein [Sandarakinorhabdus sp.]|nr:PEPxxWA-CTERM sorting domain-containing protein [Sandarakinorhabdus sp.]